MMPKITYLGPAACLDGKRFRLEGGTLRQDFAETLRPGHVAWCEITVYGDHLGSYGGEVWPMAWPELFVEPEVRTINNVGHVYVTPAGLKALEGAL